MENTFISVKSPKANEGVEGFKRRTWPLRDSLSRFELTRAIGCTVDLDVATEPEPHDDGNSTELDSEDEALSTRPRSSSDQLVLSRRRASKESWQTSSSDGWNEKSFSGRRPSDVGTSGISSSEDMGMRNPVDSLPQEVTDDVGPHDQPTTSSEDAPGSPSQKREPRVKHQGLCDRPSLSLSLHAPLASSPTRARESLDLGAQEDLRTSTSRPSHAGASASPTRRRLQSNSAAFSAQPAAHAVAPPSFPLMMPWLPQHVAWPTCWYGQVPMLPQQSSPTAASSRGPACFPSGAAMEEQRYLRECEACVLAMRSALAACDAVASSEVQAGILGWSIIVHLRSDGFDRKKYALALMKKALLRFSRPPQALHLVGRKDRPFPATPLGFIAKLIGMPLDNTGMPCMDGACRSMLEQGVCSYGSRCRWRHPTFQKNVTVTVRLVESTP